MLSDLEKIESYVLSKQRFDQLVSSPGVHNVIRAMIVAEDRRYISHHGIDGRGMGRALFRFLSERKVEGASTIEQQFVRTARGRYELTISRKFTECLLAIFVSARHSKLIIALSYLEAAYFGWNANGIHQAAQRLGVDLEHVTRAEAAALAAMLKVPMPRFPSTRYVARHAQRVEYILTNWQAVEKRYGFTF